MTATRYEPFLSALDAIIAAETDGLADDEEVLAYARALYDTGLYRSTGSAGRFLADAAAYFGEAAITGEEVTT